MMPRWPVGKFKVASGLSVSSVLIFGEKKVLIFLQNNPTKYFNFEQFDELTEGKRFKVSFKIQ